MTTQNKNWKTMLVELEDKLAEFFTKKLPALPDKVREMIVKFGPYITVVMLVLSIPAILALLGLGFVATPLVFAGGARFGFWNIFSLVVGILMIILEIMAINGLFKRQMKAWKLLFYISLIQAFSALVRFDLGSLVIGTGISWYILFQVRSYYK
jgi:hypothetical protein